MQNAGISCTCVRYAVIHLHLPKALFCDELWYRLRDTKHFWNEILQTLQH